jgi:Ca2+-dependent lipid-binding protein
MNYDLNYLFTMFSQSDISIIGYDSISEDSKDKLLDKLNVFRLGKINEKITIKSYIRDLKISSILENSSIRLPNDIIHLDISDIKIPNSLVIGSNPIFYRDVISSIRSQLFNNSVSYKLIITTQTYNSISNSISFKVGSQILYSADFVITLKNKSAKVIKSRYDLDNIDIDISDLKNFNYICDYESNK